MDNYFLSLVISILFYILLSISFYGLGWLLVSMMKVRKAINNMFLLIWIGWAFSFLIFQTIHLIFPINLLSVAPVFLVGVIFSLPLINIAHNQKNLILDHKFQCIGLVIIFLTLTMWISSRSMLAPTNYDSGLYHFNIIRWINTFPIVPGLGNLHGRLAFNQSFFTYVAALNFYPVFNHGRSIANSFLFLLTIGTFVDYLRPVISQPITIFVSHPFKYLSVFFALPILGYLAITSDGFSSPSPDLTSTLLQLTLFVTLLRSIAGWLDGQHDQDLTAILLIILASILITIKLSNLIFALFIILFVLVYTWQASKNGKRDVFRVTIFAGFLIMVWCLRGLILSGAPLYPATIGYIPFAWAVPKASVIEEANLIYSWARTPYSHWTNVLGNWDWLIPWIKRVTLIKVEIDYPVFIFIVFSIIVLILLLFKKIDRPRMLEWLSGIPLIAAILYWFFTAPEPRFLNASLILLAVYILLIFLQVIQISTNRKIYSLILCITFLVGNFHFIYYTANHIDNLLNISYSGFQMVNQSSLIQKTTKSGLLIYTPVYGDQCWDAPLPCTPNFKSNLTLVESECIGSGFVIDN